MPRLPIHLSLKTKLAVTLGAAALIPLGLVSAVALRVSLGRLDRSLSVQSRQNAQIALNLLLRQVQRISRDASHMAADPELHELLALEPALISTYLDNFLETSEPGLVEVVLPDRRVAARGSTGEISRFERLGVRPTSEALNRALDYERHLTVSETSGQLCIQASAPVVDSMFVLRGVVVMTTPLDEQIADYIKSVVRADIGFLALDPSSLRSRTDATIRPVASTFVDDTGQRLPGAPPPPGLAERVLRGGTEDTVQRIAGHEYAIVYAPLQSVGGQRLGAMAVAIRREGLRRAQASAIRSLALGGVGSLIFALVTAYIFGRRITIPLGRLHRSTQAIAAGDLEHEVLVETQDEIGDLARAFQTMTTALREHQERLAARVREILTLHQIGRAVSSVLSLDQVLHLVVTEVASVLGAERGALLLQGKDGSLRLRDEVGLPRDEGVPQVPPAWVDLGAEVLGRHAAIVEGTMLAVPLETRERGVGALIMARRERGGSYSEADLRLVVTFADQAATAIENARLYGEVSAFSAELEGTVQKRTAELLATNQELALALNELRDAQAALVQQERMAGLGLLVAGIAHEINTPAGAIQGSAQMLGETLQRLVRRMSQFTQSDISGFEAKRIFDQLEQGRQSLATLNRLPPTEMRRRARDLATVLARHGIEDARRLAKRLLEAGAANMIDQVAVLKDRVAPELMVGMIEDLAFLEQSTVSIKAAISALVRLVRALKSYAHTDQEPSADVDITDGLETTLTILHNQLRYGITVTKNYAPLPKVLVYMDQLNQVWTNLIHNAVQAMNGKGELTLETFQEGQEIGVRVIDNGPGIPPTVMPRIFEPFFTTKPAGEGTGLGLGIARQIVEKHGGRMQVESRPGRTCFTVRLPLSGAPRPAATEDEPTADGNRTEPA
jgi:signal transduction histidine kinase/HAMP domain-containing protein